MLLGCYRERMAQKSTNDPNRNSKAPTSPAYFGMIKNSLVEEISAQKQIETWKERVRKAVPVLTLKVRRACGSSSSSLSTQSMDANGKNEQLLWKKSNQPSAGLVSTAKMEIMEAEKKRPKPARATSKVKTLS